MTTEYEVCWRIDIEADSPYEAALKAREIVMDPTSTATIWEVTGPVKQEIDLHLDPVDYHPIRYDAVLEGLRTLADYAIGLGASIHMPRIGCGLAGGDWRIIEAIIQVSLIDPGIDVTVYDLKE